MYSSQKFSLRGQERRGRKKNRRTPLAAPCPLPSEKKEPSSCSSTFLNEERHPMGLIHPQEVCQACLLLYPGPASLVGSLTHLVLLRGTQAPLLSCRVPRPPPLSPQAHSVPRRGPQTSSPPPPPVPPQAPRSTLCPSRSPACLVLWQSPQARLVPQWGLQAHPVPARGSQARAVP